MKLRIQRNTIRLRLLRSEVASLVENGKLGETICFGPDPGSELIYTLACDDSRSLLDVEAPPGQVNVLLPSQMVHAWAESDRVGIEGEVDLGFRGTLWVLIEKDFACIDRTAKENADVFPNPAATGHVC